MLSSNERQTRVEQWETHTHGDGREIAPRGTLRRSQESFVCATCFFGAFWSFIRDCKFIF